MADKKMIVMFSYAIILLLGDCVLAADGCYFEVIKDPSNQFQSPTSNVPAAEISDVTTLSLGMSTEPISYDRLKVGDIFHRPSASLSLVLELQPNSNWRDIKTCTLTQEEDINFKSTRESILSEFGEDGPVIVDYASSFKLSKTPQNLRNSFSIVPSTLDGMQSLLQKENSILETEDLGLLNASNIVDLNFLSELQLMKEVFNKVSDDAKSVVDGTPDLYAFLLSGLRRIQEVYGPNSEQVRDATRVMDSVLQQLYKDASKIYHDNILITMTTVEKRMALRRMIRATDVTVTPTKGQLNVAPYYGQDFPIIFNIILWLVIFLILSIYAIAYLLGSMDPGDTIIYRMTSQRIKVD